MTLLALAMTVLAVGYGALMTAYGIGFRRVLRPADNRSASRPTASVVIAARNEALTIADCLRSVIANGSLVREIIVVDDQSIDATAQVVETFADAAPSDGPAIRIVRLSDAYENAPAGKTEAIRTGVNAASSDVILSTDADCRVTPEWARSMLDCFEDGVLFVSGPVRFGPLQSIADRLQGLEFLGLVSAGAGGIGIGWPSMCNSANIAYRRQTYLDYQVGLDSALPHDEIMLQTLHRRDAGSVRFCASADAVVQTPPARSWGEFFDQRRRWAGTGARYPSPSLVMMISAVYAFYLMLLISAVSVWWLPALLPFLLTALLIKILSEASLLLPATRRFADGGLMHLFVPAQLLQIPYVVVIGIAGLVGGSTWKGRQIRSRA